jgi:hypothetical protein
MYKTCQHCIYYIRPIINDKYEIGNYFGKCIKFTNNDTMLGDVDYKYEGKYHNPGETTNSYDIPSL